ncbi:MAG: response regulator [Bryobacteraceae bacterium]|jgi:CheY-like chemotaxis protein
MACRTGEWDEIEAAHHIRAEERPASAHVPIIALTANTMRGDSDKCLDAGMDGYISKPIRMGDLDRILFERGSAVAPAP